MTVPFSPHQAEKEITCRITAREAFVIKTLRSYPYGKFVIHKLNGRLVRVEMEESKLIEEVTGLDLAEK
ncbi:MAG: hypothetical protein NUV73_04460 [Candidatus Daviesbacteria bacterium]|nr:hypothetical protein [Candidatus Daviesbacteria bacterium]